MTSYYSRSVFVTSKVFGLFSLAKATLESQFTCFSDRIDLKEGNLDLGEAREDVRGWSLSILMVDLLGSWTTPGHPGDCFLPDLLCQ